MKIQEDEISKYLKQKESNISKAKKKSKHKHQYEECLLQYYFKESDHLETDLSSYCIICGKMGGKLKNSIVTDYMRKVDKSSGVYYQLISSDELYEKYRDKMPVFFVGDIGKDKYIEQKNRRCLYDELV